MGNNIAGNVVVITGASAVAFALIQPENLDVNEILCRRARNLKLIPWGREVHMSARNESLTDRLSRDREITISVTGRKSGRTISIPVWFVLDGEKLYLVPVQGSDTQWYKNTLKDPLIRINAGGARVDFNAVPITDAAQVKSVVEKFREKYGANDVKKYYSKFDVAVVVRMR